MNKRIGLISYGFAGNINSIKKSLDKTGAQTTIVESPSQLQLVDKIVLPGVGSFPNAINELKKSNLFGSLQRVITEKPTLGICLGMQILSTVGFEHTKTEGLGVFEAEVRPVLCDAAVPHMGFNKIRVQNDNDLLKGLDNVYFYFMHSFEVVNYRNILALTQYSGHDFVSVMAKEHVFGVQFHPEKSRDAGMELFRNFINF